jgi:chromosome segregation and condensation protein ScpB
LHVLGPQRTLDLTYAVDPAAFEGARSSGQYIEALEREGLIEAVPQPKGQANKYRLTARGSIAAQLISLACPPPTADTLLTAAEKRWAVRRATQRRATLAQHGPRGLSVHQASVIETLQSEGPLTRLEIFERMDAPPKNRGSLALMLKTLQERRIVQRLAKSGGGSAYLWAVAAKPPSSVIPTDA